MILSPKLLRTIGVVTVGRSDYGIYRPLLRRIQNEPGLRLRLFVGGAHLSARQGMTVTEIEAEGFPIASRVDHLETGDDPESVAVSMGRGTAGFARALAHDRPDILVALGDRFEMHAAALAALPLKIPVAHIHGGELTEGAMDDALRHSLTKLSHLHFVATEEYRRRVIQLGEEPWRVTISGAPGLDNLGETPLLSSRALSVPDRFLLVTFHPVTLEHEQTETQIDALLSALDTTGLPVVFTSPNADTANATVRQRIRMFIEAHPSAQLIENAGTQRYFSLMASAAAMVGNSSSGLIEAPSFKLPVVNVGNRQRGRLRAANVVDVGESREQILEGIGRAVSPAFRMGLTGLVNPYGSGRASEIIVNHLKEIALDGRLLVKRFYDMARESA